MNVTKLLVNKGCTSLHLINFGVACYVVNFRFLYGTDLHIKIKEEKLLPLNLLKSELQYPNLFWNARVMNEGD